MEPLTAATIVTLAFTKIFETSIEKFTESALEKMGELRKKIWQKLSGKTEAVAALKSAEQGSQTEVEKIAGYLEAVMKEEPDFADEIAKLAREIQSEMPSEGKVGTQEMHIHGDNSKNYQTQINEPQAPTFIGGEHHH